jgi:hypothetical protein
LHQRGNRCNGLFVRRLEPKLLREERDSVCQAGEQDAFSDLMALMERQLFYHRP